MKNIVKIPMTEHDRKKANRELRDWKDKKESAEMNIKSYKGQLEKKLPIVMTEAKIVNAKEQILLNQQNIEIWEEQLKNQPLAGLKKDITKAQEEIEGLEHNIKIREKELREGFLRDITTGEVLQKTKE